MRKPSLPLSIVNICPVIEGGQVQKSVWQLACAYYLNHPEHRIVKVIELGFVFDGASIPALFWWLLRLHPFSPRVINAALEHDYGYRYGWNRLATDKMFYLNLRKHGINKIRAWVMYAGVRAVGWVFYLPERHWLKALALKVF